MNDTAHKTTLEKARYWYALLSSETAAQEDWEGFTKWLEQSPQNGEAYDQIELFMSGIGPSEHAVVNQADNVVELPEKRRPAWSLNPAGIARIAALLIAAFVVFSTVRIFNTPKFETQHYATAIGQRDQILLADGSQIDLNTNTQLSILTNKKNHLVTLHKGEAFFDITPANQRPFIIKAMGAEIRDIGTQFSVYLADDHLSVSVAEGIVDMKTPPQKTRLTKGKRGVYENGSEAIEVTTIDASSVSTWRKGVLVFEDAPLSVILPELNRYFKTPTVLADEKVGSLTFSGALNVKDQAEMLKSLEALLPISITRNDNKIILSSKQ